LRFYTKWTPGAYVGGAGQAPAQANCKAWPDMSVELEDGRT